MIGWAGPANTHPGMSYVWTLYYGFLLGITFCWDIYKVHIITMAIREHTLKFLLLKLVWKRILIEKPFRLFIHQTFITYDLNVHNQQTNYMSHRLCLSLSNYTSVTESSFKYMLLKSYKIPYWQFGLSSGKADRCLVAENFVTSVTADAIAECQTGKKWTVILCLAL